MLNISHYFCNDYLCLGLAEECTIWRFSLKETHLELDTGFSFEARDVTAVCGYL